jgi:hypothetical protein
VDDTRPREADPVPLAERILRALPGPRVLWILLWSAVALLRPALVALQLGEREISRGRNIGDLFVIQGVFAYVVAVSLWAAPRLAAQVRSTRPDIERLAPGIAGGDVVPRLGSVAWPILLALAIVALALPSTLADYGVTIALLDIPLLGVMVLPITTFVWTYLAILAGLSRLGGTPLALDRFPEDRSLGLGPIGAVAFRGFAVTVAAAAPALFVTGGDITTFAITVGVVVLVAALFVLSMVRLHGQMAVARDRYVASTRALVAQAYAPIRAQPTLATLGEHASVLGAAQSLADRAERILAWPIDERMVAFMTVVVTGVVTSLLVRLVLLAAGI